MSFYDPLMEKKMAQKQFELLMRQREAETQEYMRRHPDHYSQGLNPSLAQGGVAVSSDTRHDNPVLLLL